MIRVRGRHHGNDIGTLRRQVHEGLDAAHVESRVACRGQQHGTMGGDKIGHTVEGAKQGRSTGLIP